MPRPVLTAEEEKKFSELKDSVYALFRKEMEMWGKAHLAINGALFGNMLTNLFVAVVVAYYDELKPGVPKQLLMWFCVSLIASSFFSIGLSFCKLLRLKDPWSSLIRNIHKLKENITELERLIDAKITEEDSHVNQSPSPPSAIWAQAYTLCIPFLSNQSRREGLIKKRLDTLKKSSNTPYTIIMFGYVAMLGCIVFGSSLSLICILVKLFL